MPDIKNSKNEFKEKSGILEASGQEIFESLPSSVEAAPVIEINPDAFAGLEENEAPKPAAELVQQPAVEITPDKGIPVLPPTNLAPEVPSAKVEADGVVTDNVASITPQGISLSRYKEALQAINHPSHSAFKTARQAERLFHASDEDSRDLPKAA